MKNLNYLLFAFMAIVMISCAKKEIPVSVSDPGRTASSFSATKGSADKVDLNGVEVTWVEGDVIYLYASETPTEDHCFTYYVAEADMSEDHKTVTFSIPDGQKIGAGPYYAVAGMDGFNCDFDLTKKVINVYPQNDGYFTDCDFLTARGDEYQDFTCILTFHQPVGFVKFNCDKEDVTKAHFVSDIPCGGKGFACGFTGGGWPKVTVPSVNFCSDDLMYAEGEYYFPVMYNTYADFEIMLSGAGGKGYGVKLPNGLKLSRGHVMNLGDISSKLTEYIYYESFDACSSSSGGGNDGQFGIVAGTSEVFSPDVTGYAQENAHSGYSCVWFGSSKVTGTFKTPALGLTKPCATLSFRAATYKNDEDRTKPVMVSVEGNGVLSKYEFYNDKDEFADCTLEIMGADDNTKIVFSGYEAKRSRFFLDEIKVLENDRTQWVAMDKSEAKLPVEGGTVTLNVTANVAWTATCEGVESFTVSDNVLTAVVAPNATYDPKEFVVNVTGSGETASCVIKQAPRTDRIEFEEHTVLISPDSSSVSVNLTSNVSWTASCEGATAVSPAGGTGDSEITVTLPANTTGEMKKYQLIVTNGSVADTCLIKHGKEYFIKVQGKPITYPEINDWVGDNYLYVCESSQCALKGDATISPAGGRFPSVLVMIDSSLTDTTGRKIYRIEATDDLKKCTLEIRKSTWPEAKGLDLAIVIQGKYLTCANATKVTLTSLESDNSNWRMFSAQGDPNKDVYFRQYGMNGTGWGKLTRIFYYSGGTSDWRTPTAAPDGTSTWPYCQLYRLVD